MPLLKSEYSEDELERSDWLIVRCTRVRGYPQPVLDLGYLALTYDLAEHCSQCGIGAVQKAPFRLLGEPEWEDARVFCLNWIPDELFATPEIWRAVFHPLGVGWLPVLDREGHELESVVQLQIDERLPVELPSSAPVETCVRCDRSKRHPLAWPQLPGDLAREPVANLARTREHYGSGGQAFRRIVVSRHAFREIRSAGVGPLWFAPLLAEGKAARRATGKSRSVGVG
jgi:hypothetical protein